MKKVKIADSLIGEGEPVFIVAEAGTTCNGDLNTALQIVDAAKKAGADAVKFMIIGPDYFMSDKSVIYEYDWAGGRKAENMYEMFKKLEFSREEWIKIRDHCRKQEIIFYATVDYLPGVDLAEELGVAAYKISSWDANNFPLARRMAKTLKPVQIDTGPTTIDEIEKLLNVIYAEGNTQVILVHCSHAGSDESINVRSVPFMKQAFNIPVGYSADERDHVPDIIAVSLGANLIEKRLTIQRRHPGHHHVKALDPEEFMEYVAMIRRAEHALGEHTVKPSSEDLRQKDKYFVSIVADIDITAGMVITRDMLACKRPGTGISPEFLDRFVGQNARRDIKRNELISWDDV